MSGTVVKHEVWLRADDHVERLVARLIHLELRFAVRPERDGWWKVNAWMPSGLTIGDLDPKPLDGLAQQTRAAR